LHCMLICHQHCRWCLQLLMAYQCTCEVAKHSVTGNQMPCAPFLHTRTSAWTAAQLDQTNTVQVCQHLYRCSRRKCTTCCCCQTSSSTTGAAVCCINKACCNELHQQATCNCCSAVAAPLLCCIEQGVVSRLWRRQSTSSGDPCC
jgi:hypothetical protein